MPPHVAGQPSVLNQIYDFGSTWGDTASVFGLLLAIIGFGVTIVGVWRSKAAAIKAREAVDRVVQQMQTFDIIAELNATLAVIDETKRLQRARAWAVLPDRYAEIRRRLASVQSSGSRVSHEHREVIRRSILVLRRSEKKVEEALANNDAPPDPAKLNTILSAQFDEVHGVLRQMRMEYEDVQ